MSTNIERAAEVIAGCDRGYSYDQSLDPTEAAAALAAEGLLVTDEQQRLIELGRKLEEIETQSTELTAHVTDDEVVQIQAHFAEIDRLVRAGKVFEGQSVMLRRAASASRNVSKADWFGWVSEYLDRLADQLEAEAQP